MTRTKNALLAALAGGTLLAAPLEAVVVPSGSAVKEKEYRNPALYVPTSHTALSALRRDGTAAPLENELASLGVSDSAALWDAQAQRWGSLFPAEPLIPGTGVGNTLRWQELGAGARPTEAAIKQQAWRAFTAYLERHQSVLRLDLSELGKPNLAVFDEGALVQIWVPRRVAGVLVRDNSIVAVINHGNLVLLGFEKWAEANLTPDAAVSDEQARGTVATHVAPFAFQIGARKPHLELVPMSRGERASGFDYRLAWVVTGSIDGDLGTWEALVDAGTGELLAFEDRNQYAQVKRVIGGVFPVSNDQTPPDGVEKPGTPMPFLNVTLTDGTNAVTTTGGVIGCVQSSGPTARQLRTQLAGPYLRMNDNCGLVRESAFADSELQFNLESGPGTDCVVPVGHSAGDTHASRTGFYELNRLIDQTRGYLPANTWLQTQLTSNMNINLSCNAFWSPSAGTVNFYRDKNSACRNTGEIAAIFDHEWGHGLDYNGVNPTGAPPREGIADITAILRLQDSCGGRGFFKLGNNCGGSGYGDACLACSGVRDLDFAKHASGLAHNIDWIMGLRPPGGCNAAVCVGPCNRECHCEGQAQAEVGWDLFARDLQQPPFGFDSNTALERATRLFTIGSGPVTSWYTCTAPEGGCDALGGYKNILAVDDDNGDITDGTPHISAIFAAFNRHQMACNSPAPTNSGCATGPNTAPITFTVTPVDQGARLTWSAVPLATRYQIFRTEGVRGCNFGKTKIGETTGLSFEDQGLANGIDYFYAVLPVTGNCFGRMSACSTVRPVPGPNLRTLPALPIQVVGGDGDEFLDNCETARLTVRVENNGIVPLTNVNIIGATSSTHPLTTSSGPANIAAALAPCSQASVTYDVTPHGMAFNDTFEVTVTITADQIAPSTRTVTYRATRVETDFVNRASQTYTFDAGMQGWTVTAGTFNRVDAGSGNFYLASSSCLDNQCDIARSPLLKLSGTSTLSLKQRYDTETPVPTPFDRANVGLFDVAAGTRTTVSPDGGDPYDLPAGAANGDASCGTLLQAGWATDSDNDCTATAPFVASTWSPGALNPGGAFTNRNAQLSVNYGTDDLVAGYGFHFDDVVLTNFQEAVADAQACLAPGLRPRPGIALDGMKARATKR